MTDTPTAQTVATTLARIKTELPSDTAVNVDGLITDLAFVFKTEINADIKTNAPHIPLVGGWIVGGGISIVDQTIDNSVNQIETAIGAALAPQPAPGT